MGRSQISHDRWIEHRTILEPHRVGPYDRRTTPPSSIDIGRFFPELKNQTTITVRLNPRYGEEPAVDASKLGGTLIWPLEEPWPICTAHKIPFVGVLQLRSDDFPEMPFPPGMDLFQLLWCPREHDEWPMCWAYPKFFWRRLQNIGNPRTDNPPLTDAYYEYVPFPCRLMPERIVEFPSVYELSEELVHKIEKWESQNLNDAGYRKYCYESDLSVCLGTKIGGHLHWIQSPWIPTCSCGIVMQHLLTIETLEWNGVVDEAWTPIEEKLIFSKYPSSWNEHDHAQKKLRKALWNPTGLSLGDGGHMQLFVCRNCPDWPIIPAIESC